MENVYRMSKEKITEMRISSLPTSLGEAVNELRKDKVVQEALGEYCYQRFSRLKETEWKEYLAAIEKTGDPGTKISEWEIADIPFLIEIRKYKSDMRFDAYLGNSLGTGSFV